MATQDYRRLMRWQIAFDTGWSLEYIDQLSQEDIWEYLSVKDGVAKAMKY